MGLEEGFKDLQGLSCSDVRGECVLEFGGWSFAWPLAPPSAVGQLTVALWKGCSSAGVLTNKQGPVHEGICKW